MKNLKKFLALGLVAAMTFSFAACGKDNNTGKQDNEKVEHNKDDNKDDSKDDTTNDSKDDSKKVTAEDLLKDIPIDEIKSGSVTLKFVLDIGIDTEQIMLDEGMTKDDIQTAIDEGAITEADLNMAMSLDMNLTTDATEDYSYVYGKMDINFAGEEQSMTMKSYSDSSEEGKTITYTYDEESDSWYYEEEYAEDEADDAVNSDYIDEFMEYVKSAKITDEDDDKYTLSVVFDLAKFYQDDSEAVEDIIGSVSDSLDDTIGATEDIFETIDELEAAVEIDKENGYPTDIKFDLSDILAEYLEKSSEEEETEAVDYSKYVSINEFSLAIELSDFNNVEVKIPEEVIDEAVEGSVDTDLDIDDDDDDDDDDDVVVITDDKFEIFDYDGNSLAKFTVPEGYYVDTEYSGKTWVYLEDDDWNSIEISCSPLYWVEGLIDGEEYEADLDFYTRDEVYEAESIETSQGTVRVFINIWSFDDNPEEDYHQTVIYVLMNEDGSMPSVETDVDEIEGKGYTIESLITAMLQ